MVIHSPGKGTGVSFSPGVSVSRFWLAVRRVSALLAPYVLHVRKTLVVTGYGDNYMAKRKQKLSAYPTQCRCDNFYCHGLVTTASLMQLTSISQMENTGLDCTEQNIRGIRMGKRDISF